jgi:hypothetical protein
LSTKAQKKANIFWEKKNIVPRRLSRSRAPPLVRHQLFRWGHPALLVGTSIWPT